MVKKPRKKITDGAGYVLVYSPNHPFHNEGNYVFEHRLVLENWLRINKPDHLALIEVDGVKYLHKEWKVHHWNEIKYDNIIENLHPIPNMSEHNRFHSFKYINNYLKTLDQESIARWRKAMIHGVMLRKEEKRRSMKKKRRKPSKKRQDGLGYILIYSPNHPFKRKNNYVCEHRLVMENWLRTNKPDHPALIEINGMLYLRKNWEVHRWNGIKNDNNADNLYPVLNSENNRRHTGKYFQEYLKTLDDEAKARRKEAMIRGMAIKKKLREEKYKSALK